MTEGTPPAEIGFCWQPQAEERPLLGKPGGGGGGWTLPGEREAQGSPGGLRQAGCTELFPPVAAREKRTVRPTAAALTAQGWVLAELAHLGHSPLFWNGHHPYLGTVLVETARVPRCPAAAGPAPLLARLRPGPHLEPQSQATLRSPAGPELTPARRESLSLKCQALRLAEDPLSAQNKQGS